MIPVKKLGVCISKLTNRDSDINCPFIWGGYNRASSNPGVRIFKISPGHGSQPVKGISYVLGSHLPAADESACLIGRVERIVYALADIKYYVPGFRYIPAFNNGAGL